MNKGKSIRSLRKSRKPLTKPRLKTSIQLTATGELVTLNELFRNKPFFRKPTSPDSNEHFIYQLLARKRHPNLVKVYRITDEYVDVELLHLVNNAKHKRRRKNAMAQAKTFLQRNNIAYIDWKPDNTGVDAKGNFKLFDFDASGVFNRDGEWVLRAPDYFIMRNAPVGYSPTQIDDWAFERNM